MRVLSRYIVREIVVQFAVIGAIVLGIFLIRRFGVLLTDAAEGALPADVLFELLSLRTIMALPSLLPAVLYLSILLALGRLHQDQEILAAEACGVSPLRVSRIVLSFAMMAAVAVGLLGLSIRPWAADKFERARSDAVRTLNVGGLLPGRFHETGPEGRQVIFAEGRAGDGAMRDVFVQERRGPELSIVLSERGIERLDPESGYRYLTLQEGYRYDLDPERGRYEITEFGDLVVRTTLRPGLLDDGGEKSRSISELLRSSTLDDAAELQWRLAMPVSVLVLALLALSFSRVEPRQSKYGRLFLALVAYLVYRQLLGVAKDWVAGGLMPPMPGLWAVHALALGAGVGLLALQQPVRRTLWRSSSRARKDRLERSASDGGARHLSGGAR